MSNKSVRSRISAALAALALSTMTCHSAVAAPGTLATAPLFLSTIVEPNVFFTLDDSGSMDWEQMVRDGTGGFFSSSGLPLIGRYFRYYYNPEWIVNAYVLPPSAGQKKSWVNDIWIFRTSEGNKNYYNPAINYVPWAGVKADGSPMYLNADPTRALFDPNSPGGTRTNLTVAKNYFDYDDCWCWRKGSVYLPTYYTWSDSNGNNKIDPGDTHSKVTIAAGSTEMQNFANWFVYYRSREYAAKAAIGRVINNTDATRMGLDVYNAGHQVNLKSMTDPTNKRKMLESFYSINSSGGTPARNSLKRVGELFKSTGTNAPILPAAQGGECQQNFNILMSDGFWNGWNPGGIGNADGDVNTAFDGNASQSNDGGNYADSYSITLADVAMHYYENDLRPSLLNKVPVTPGIDEADHQHLVTYTIAFGLNGQLDPATDDPLSAGFSWPRPSRSSITTVDDMWHTAYNGRGKFLSAQNPAELEQSLNESISDIAERTATAAAVSINSAKLTTESVVYLAQFNTNRWQGDLFAFKIVDLNTGQLATTEDWSASSVLTARNVSTDPRVILTYDGTDGIPFQWNNLGSFQQDDLRISPTGTIDSDTIAKARLAYLRGDRSNEGAGQFFRERASLLGDLVNSGPVFVGAPSLKIPDTAPFPTMPGSRYSDFKNGSAKTRNGVIYAGANDGMLHGFAESTGKEILAYIPGSLFSKANADGLHYLTDQSYQHQYYNDLTPTISDIYANIGGGLKWNSVLVSGLRGGGRGIYALDVTNPASFSETSTNASKLVLWEFTDNDLGFTYSKPQIGMVNDNSWVAIFGNGYNDTGDGKAKLFILDISKGADGSWDVGDFRVISTGSGSMSNRNGLATPALADLDGNGTIDRAYAGDLKGQMWAFDLSDASPANWGVDLLFTTKGNRPITAKPTLAKHPNISTDNTNKPNVMVFFGSGQYLVDADKGAPFYNDYFYGVWDKGDINLTSTTLVEQTYDTSFSPRVLTRNPVNYGGGEYGWFLGLPDTGERSVTRPVVRGTAVFFNTFVPNSDPCSVGGYGYRFTVDLVNGGATEEPQTDVNQDGTVDAQDQADNGIAKASVSALKQEGFLPEPVFIEDIAYTGETPSKVRELPNITRGRLSWQELLQ